MDLLEIWLTGKCAGVYMLLLLAMSLACWSPIVAIGSAAL